MVELLFVQKAEKKQPIIFFSVLFPLSLSFLVTRTTGTGCGLTATSEIVGLGRGWERFQVVPLL